MYDEVGAPLRFWFAACFGFAAAASAVAISLKLHCLVHTVRARQHEVFASSKPNAIKQKLDEVRLELRALYCYVLLTVFEDIPLGSLNLAYLRLILINPTNVKAQSTTGAMLTMATFSSTLLIIGYNCRQILGLPDLWKRQQSLEESCFVLERARIVLQQHCMTNAVREWRAAAFYKIRPPFCKPNDAAEVHAARTSNSEEREEASFQLEGKSAIDDTNGEVYITVDMTADDMSSVKEGPLKPSEPEFTIDTADRDKLKNASVASDAASRASLDENAARDNTKHAAEAGRCCASCEAVGLLAPVSRPSQVATQRSSLSVVWDPLLGKAVVSMERHEDSSAEDLRLRTRVTTKEPQGTSHGTEGTSPKTHDTCGSKRTLTLQWDERTNAATVSINRLDKADPPSARGVLSPHQQQSVHRPPNPEEKETSLFSRMVRPTLRNQAASAPARADLMPSSLLDSRSLSLSPYLAALLLASESEITQNLHHTYVGRADELAWI